MTSIWLRRLLWAVLLLTLPVPFWFISGGRAPTLVLFQICAYLLPVWVSEGGPGATLALQALGAQGLAWAAVLYVVSRVLVRLLGRFSEGRPPVAGVAVVVVALFAISLLPVYAGAILARGAPVNLLHVY